MAPRQSYFLFIVLVSGVSVFDDSQQYYENFYFIYLCSPVRVFIKVTINSTSGSDNSLPV